ncbi:hypothetical protein [Rhizobium sp. SSA_523]|uniref:hypothetical protein n=1 Tax=Rhizobium sp. SSA_523 TaxID=2952477 RepID=UPI0020911218|nr:hypothetical protein [Rhizobium sp. SSA_523]MCO5734722.1 hypothetical protein [Rhizobium sp. SSA_523]WKC22965.1 hypothetical protein QTJ18_19255 [Rhizobium sp. SSA_523]
MKLIDPTHPFFKPLWRRILTVVLPAVWGLVELSNNAIGWAIIFLAASAYAAYELLIMYHRSIARAAAEDAEKQARLAAERGDEE